MDTCHSQTVLELLNCFGLPDAAVERLPHSIHDNLRVRSGSEAFFLKIVETPYDERRVRSQLEFMDHLRCGGLPVVETLPASDGERFAQSVDGRSIGILSRWIDGENLSERTECNWPEQCGALLARVHERSCEFQPSAGFALRVWDEVYAPETGGWLDQLLAGTAFDDASRSVILTSAERLGSMLQRFPKSKDTYGAIHADFHLDNLMFDGTNVWIIDFEDAGWGHFLFDLTWPGALSAKHHEGSRFLALFRAGYEQVRPLCAVDNDALAGFLLAAGIGVLDMVHTSPVANESRVAREWFSFAVDWLGKNLAACDQSFR